MLHADRVTSSRQIPHPAPRTPRSPSPTRLAAGWRGGALLALLVGCAPANREQLAQEVLAVDPAFADVLAKHQELAKRFETYERELALKRSTVEQGIAELRRDLAAATRAVRAKTAELRERLEPERERVRLTLSMAADELRAKQAQRASLGRSIARLKQAVKQAGPDWGPAEQARQQAQVEEMQRDTARLDRELAAMREHIRLLKIKLLLIKL